MVSGLWSLVRRYKGVVVLGTDYCYAAVRSGFVLVTHTTRVAWMLHLLYQFFADCLVLSDKKRARNLNSGRR